MMLKRKRMSCNAWKMFEDGLFTGQWSAGGRPLLWCNLPMQIPRKLRFPSFTGKPPPPAHSWWRERKTPYNSRCWEGRLGFGASGEVKMRERLWLHWKSFQGMPCHSQRARVHLDDEATKDDLPTCVKVFSIATIEGFKGSDSLGSPKESCRRCWTSLKMD